MKLPSVPGGWITYAGLGAAVAAIGYVLVKKAAGDTRDVASIIGEGIGSAAVGTVSGIATGTVKAVGATVGIPDTSADKCAAAKAAGNTFDASLYCPAGDFLSWSYSRVTGSGTSTSPNVIADRPILRRGSTGQDVRELQKKLGVEADGVFGAITERAVIDYQRSVGLKADGIVGLATWTALQNNAVKVLNESGTLTDSKYRDLVR